MSAIPAVSENYSDLIYQYPESPQALLSRLARYSPQIVDNRYAILHIPESENRATVADTGYSLVPKLFTYLSTVSLEQSGILSTQSQPILNLRGKGILVGFLDSGIDYTHPAFRNADGTTRILSIWDQSDQTGPPPAHLGYGTEYTKEQIDRALLDTDPFAAVPVRDQNGHGTAVAGIACGTPQKESDFFGAAPESEILFVRLKPAKQYLRDYFLIPEKADAFQENDLMLGVRYLAEKARILQRPLVICIALGSNQGSHSGQTPLEETLSGIQSLSGIYVVTAAGNEAGMGHHYYGKLSRQGERVDVELLVDAKTEGFTVEFWASASETFSIGLLSPGGEIIEPVQPRSKTSQEFTLLLDNTRITLDYELVEITTGTQLAMLRFSTPASGLWRIIVVGRTFINGNFHLWLPITGFIPAGIRFLDPLPDTTLVIPSCARGPITVSTSNAYNGTLFINSSRGYTSNGIIKPDFASPGVDVTAPAPGGGLRSFTGSSAAAALAAGAVCLLAEWGIRRNNPRIFTSTEIKSLFLYGILRNAALHYPNPEWGYGEMDLFGIFEAMIRP